LRQTLVAVGPLPAVSRPVPILPFGAIVTIFAAPGFCCVTAHTCVLG
jgi:hypothetical protein